MNLRISLPISALTMFVLVFGLAKVNTVKAQGSTATVLGMVTDVSGATMPDVSVEVKNLNTGFVATVSTDAEGRFRIPQLVVGEYQVQASKSGFATIVRKGIVLTVGTEAVVDFSLNVGQQQQTVTVDAQVTQVETTNATVGALVDTQQMRELPLNGRNFEQLIILAPGVQSFTAFTPNSLQGRAPEYSIGGSRVTGAGILLDDESIVNFWNKGMGTITGTSLGVEAIGEFQTLTNTYGAQFGANGAVINSVSKSGTNAFHGSAYEFLRNDALDAWNTFAKRAANPIKPPLRKNQFGGSLGGPIRRDKLFFFVNYEGIQQSTGVTRIATVPNCPAACTVTASDPTARQQIQNILNIYPHPDPGTVATGGTSGLSTQVGAQTAHENYVLGRLDYMLSSKDSFFVRAISDNAGANDPFGGSLNAATLPYWNEAEKSQSYFATLQERHIFSPNLLNVARVSFSRPEQDSITTTSTPGLQFPGYLGKVDGVVTISGLSQIGASFFTPYFYAQNRFTEADDLLWTHGGHSFHFGITILRRDSNLFAALRQSPQWTFGGLSAFLAGSAVSVTGITTDPTNYASRALRGTELYPYFQDDWKVSRTLTLNLGVRYEFQTNPIETHNQLYAITDFKTSTFFSNIPHVFKSNPSYRNFAPRIGIAWDPFADHKTSIRSGFGMFYDVIGPEIYDNGLANEYPWFTVTQQSPPPTFPFAFAGFKPTCVNSAGACPTDSPGWGYGTNKTPYTIQYNFNIQREIIPSTVLTVGYVGSHSVHQMSGLEENPPIPTIDAAGVQHFAALATNPTTGALFIRTNNRLNGNLGQFPDAQPISTSRYNSLQVTLNRRFVRNLQLQTSYVYSKCTDNGAFFLATYNSNTTTNVSNPYNQAVDKGLCVADITHTLRMNGVLALPFRGNRLVEGWQISGIVSATGGLPYTVTDGGFGQAGQGIGGRPDYRSGCDPKSGTYNGQTVGTPDLWFNPGCFAIEPVGVPGNVGRTNLRGPHLTNADISFAKSTKITERINVQFRAELFNIFNHANYGLPAAALFTQQAVTAANQSQFPGLKIGDATGGGNPNLTAGRITSLAVNGRQIQFGLRLVF